MAYSATGDEDAPASLALWPSVRACSPVASAGSPQRWAAARAQSEKHIEYWLVIGGVWECCTTFFDRVRNDWQSVLSHAEQGAAKKRKTDPNPAEHGAPDSANVLEDVARFNKEVLEWATSCDGRADGIRRRVRAKMSAEAWTQACGWLAELEQAKTAAGMGADTSHHHRRLATETDTLARVATHLDSVGARMNMQLRASLRSAQRVHARFKRHVDALRRNSIDTMHAGYLRVDETVPREQNDAYVRPHEEEATQAHARMLECIARV